jgi:hypothetical protein
MKIRLTEQHWSVLREHLATRDDVETAAVLFAFRLHA